jgi:hypothetical protein
VRDLKREIRLTLRGRVLRVHPFVKSNNAVALVSAQEIVDAERAKTRGAIHGTAMNPMRRQAGPHRRCDEISALWTFASLSLIHCQNRF